MATVCERVKAVELLMVQYYDTDWRVRSIFIRDDVAFPKPIPEILPNIPTRTVEIAGEWKVVSKVQKYDQYSEDQKFKTLRELIDCFKKCDWSEVFNQPTHLLLEAAFRELVEAGLAYEYEGNCPDPTHQYYRATRGDVATIPKEVVVVERHIRCFIEEVLT